ncbi:type II toxin-antitoxin system PemK/MazF family toxin [Actinotalea sp. Marseille-Q4924]|uniref:type II toxin-antitoxin system PemK/MazF family toxin n=1 Tax=Actinotalea sp. Marseille-Q4924 TaxID=2866571 RepID=UPI001CE46062|nr:type II toxin-antitoxin system PemK/MazF family toxin [Actinotalea sp. Marseille-Q4924]
MRARDVLTLLLRAARASTPRTTRRRPADAPVPVRGGVYPGDHTGPLRPVYAPDPDGEPDPGEIVWTWVPFEEDHSRGKDRPVLVVGHDEPWLLGLVLSTRDHDSRPDGRGESWLDLGTGDWDARRRPSEVRLDRVVRVDPAAVRREGAVLDRRRFDAVAAALRDLRR